MPFTRREFLRGVGLAAGGIGLPSVVYDRLIPYLNEPENIVPGVSTWFATSCRECPAGCGMVVRNRDSRAVKCEGNPLHPVNQGRLCARGQAAVQGLYDPDRIRQPYRRSDSGEFEVTDWITAPTAIGGALAKKARVAVMTDLQTGALAALMRQWLTALGSDRLVTYEPIDYEHVRATNGGVVPTYEIAKSDFLISFACDFLETWVSPVEYAREFSHMREIRDGRRGGFVYVGPRVSMTAANADVRIIVPPDSIIKVASALLNGSLARDAKALGIDPKAAHAASDGLANAHAPLALPGLDSESARAAAMLNARHGGDLISRARPHAVSLISTRTEVDGLVRDMENGAIDVLLVYGTNPAYSLPDSERFKQALKRVKVTVSLSSCFDETAALADWILPSNTPLESWGDYEPYPGVANLMQPLMGTLYNTQQVGDTLIGLAGSAGVNTTDVFKADGFQQYLQARWGMAAAQNKDAWEELLQRGGRFGSVPASASATPATGYNTFADPPPQSVLDGDSALRLWAFPQHLLLRRPRREQMVASGDAGAGHQGRVGNVGGACTHRRRARLGVSSRRCDRDRERRREGNGSRLRMGRRRAGHRGRAHWRGPYGLRPLREGHRSQRLSAAERAVTDGAGHEDRWPQVGGADKGIDRPARPRDRPDRARSAPSSGARSRSSCRCRPATRSGTSTPATSTQKHRWAMVVDLNKCIGCHACVTACYAENNLGMVGPEAIWRRRRDVLDADRPLHRLAQSGPRRFCSSRCSASSATPRRASRSVRSLPRLTAMRA